MKRPIENNSSPGQAIYEPFCGSGTTIIAAELTSRVCHGIELLGQYVDVAVERWQAFAGETARMDAASKRWPTNAGNPVADTHLRHRSRLADSCSLLPVGNHEGRSPRYN
ncbi:MAG: DNA methyltransferase [Xanthobacteraceae bacterium]